MAVSLGEMLHCVENVVISLEQGGPRGMVDELDLVTIAHFARSLGLSRWAIYAWLAKEDFARECLVPVDGRSYIRTTAARQWIARYRQQRAAPSGASITLQGQ